MQNALLQKENEELKTALEAKKRKRAGVTVKNLGTHLFSTEDCLGRVHAAEEATATKKGKGKQMEHPEDSQGPLEENPFISSH